MLEEAVHPSPKEDRGWCTSKAVQMHVPKQEIWNIEGPLVVDAVKDYQIFQPHNATTVVSLAKRVSEEPMNVAIKRIPQLNTLGAARVVDSFTDLGPCGLTFIFIQIS